MGKKIFIVTHGCYSDYGISAVFETPEDAYNFIIEDGKADQIDDSSGYGYRVEIYNLGAAKSKSNRKLFHVEMNSNREVISVNEIPKDNEDGITPISINGTMFYRKGGKKTIEVQCFADDEKHAIKITSEKLTEVKALRLWDHN